MSQISNHTTIGLSEGYVNLRNIGLTAGNSLEFIAQPMTDLTVVNLGRLVADGHNAVVAFEGAVGPSHYFPGAGLSVVNDNTIVAKHTGTVDIYSNLNQTNNGVLMAQTGGTLVVAGNVTGGTVEVSDSTLMIAPPLNEFETSNGPPGLNYDSVRSSVALGGASDVIAFPWLAHDTLMTLFNGITNDLTVFAKTQPSTMAPTGELQAADLRLVGHYQAQDFTVKGNEVLFKPV